MGWARDLASGRTEARATTGTGSSVHEQRCPRIRLDFGPDGAVGRGESGVSLWIPRSTRPGTRGERGPERAPQDLSTTYFPRGWSSHLRAQRGHGDPCACSNYSQPLFPPHRRVLLPGLMQTRVTPGAPGRPPRPPEPHQRHEAPEPTSPHLTLLGLPRTEEPNDRPGTAHAQEHRTFCRTLPSRPVTRAPH